MHPASVVIPYRPRDAWGEALFNWVCEWWSGEPEWEIVACDSDPDLPFNRSEARNNGALKAAHEVLIFCDADTTPKHSMDILQAVDNISVNDDQAWYGSKTYYQMTEAFTRFAIEGNLDFDEENDLAWGKAMQAVPGGITICGFNAYDRAGGYDEHFEGWGYEDSAFQAAMTSMYGERQLFGDVFHFWHPKVRADRQAQPNIAANRGLYERYAATTSPTELDELLDTLREERHG